MTAASSRQRIGREPTTKGCFLRFLPLILVSWTLPVVFLLVKPDRVKIGSWEQIPFVAVVGLLVFVAFMVPYGDFLVKLDIRRFCRKHGLTLVKIKVTRKIYGVTYLKDDEKKYGRWPEDFKQFEPKEQEPANPG